jgi:hypothetical protein
MYVAHLLDEFQEFKIFTRRRPSMLSITFNNESVWMVPDTVSADD